MYSNNNRIRSEFKDVLYFLVTVAVSLNTYNIFVSVVISDVLILLSPFCTVFLLCTLSAHNVDSIYYT